MSASTLSHTQEAYKDYDVQENPQTLEDIGKHLMMLRIPFSENYRVNKVLHVDFKVLNSNVSAPLPYPYRILCSLKGRANST